MAISMPCLLTVSMIERTSTLANPPPVASVRVAPETTAETTARRIPVGIPVRSPGEYLR